MTPERREQLLHIANANAGAECEALREALAEVDRLRAELEAVKAETERFAELYAEKVTAGLRAEVQRLREAIQTHSECVATCERCGHDTPCADDDVCAALSPSPEPRAWRERQSDPAFREKVAREEEKLRDVPVEEILRPVAPPPREVEPKGCMCEPLRPGESHAPGCTVNPDARALAYAPEPTQGGRPDGCVCPNPALHRELAAGKPIDTTLCYRPEPTQSEPGRCNKIFCRDPSCLASNPRAPDPAPGVSKGGLEKVLHGLRKRQENAKKETT